MIGINHVLPAHSMMTFFLFFFEVQNECNIKECMKARFKALLTVLVMVVAILPSHGQLPVITSFSQSGVLICSNLEVGSVATVAWAIETYRKRPEHFRILQRRGMKKHFGWDAAARKYADVYGWAVKARRGE